jgi:isoamylase
MAVGEGLVAVGAPPVKQTLHRVWSPQMRNRRDVDVYLPASYGRGRRRYPTVYMHDGQNLSDPALAFAGTWQLDAVLRALAERGVEPIVVGVHNTEDRLAEYSPYPDGRHGGGDADSYLAFLAETLKPRVDRTFRTRRGPAHTAIVGSSMGGLVSLYGWFHRPDVFGHAGVMSPSLWFGRARLFHDVESATMPGRGRLYLDVGTAEGGKTLPDVRAMRQLLLERGIGRDALEYVEDRGGRHQEASWSRRLGRALEFLLT